MMTQMSFLGELLLQTASMYNASLKVLNKLRWDAVPAWGCWSQDSCHTHPPLRLCPGLSALGSALWDSYPAHSGFLQNIHTHHIHKDDVVGTQKKIILSNWTVITVSIDVVITSISLSVIVSVFLVDVGNGGTVITCITERISVRVLLIFIGNQPTVILKKNYINIYIVLIHILN